MRVLIAALLGTAFTAYAYPEFQRHVQENSGRPVNCAMCHVNSDGPEGSGHGQLGSLNGEELNRLNAARGAFVPGVAVSSPILNEFGNHIIYVIGKQKFVELRARPGDLAANYGFMSDLDHDGIADAQEYLDGTHPLNAAHGAPLKLLWDNLNRYSFHVLMLLLATIAGLLGFNNVLRGFAARMARAGRE